MMRWTGMLRRTGPVMMGALLIMGAPGRDTTAYPSDDDHPNAAGSRKATAESVPMLNAFYARWRAR